MKKLAIATLVIAIVAIVILALRVRKLQIVDNSKDQIITALTDTLHITRNNLNQEVANRASFDMTVTDQFLKIKSQDSTIQELQKVVNTNKNRLGDHGSVTTFSTSTSIDKAFATGKVELPINSSPVGINYPIYKTDFNLDNWVSGNIEAGKDSTKIKLEVNNQYELVLGEEKGRSFGEITNLNPYSHTKTMQVFAKKPLPAKTWGIGLGIGYGVGVHDNQVFTTPIIGIVLTKTFIRW